MERNTVFFSLYPFVMDFKEITYDLSKALSKIEEIDFRVRNKDKLFYLQDITLTEHSIRILYFIGNKAKVAYLDKSGKTVLYTVQLPETSSFYSASMLFLDDRTIAGLDKTRKKVLILK